MMRPPCGSFMGFVIGGFFFAGVVDTAL